MDYASRMDSHLNNGLVRSQIIGLFQIIPIIQSAVLVGCFR